MFSGASNFVEGVDLSLVVILGISIFFLVGITAVMIYFVIKYNRKKNPRATSQMAHHTGLEVLWTAIPTLLVGVMFYFGWVGYKPMRKPPADAIQINAIGQMWKWTFEYPNGKLSDSLVIPKDKAVKLNLISKDVLHSFYIPAFRIKEDVVPGKNNFMWFEANKLGTYDVLCAEYCGQLHAYMLTTTNVLEKPAYENWLNTSQTAADEHPGLTLLKQNACISCHSLDGNRLVGPSFKGIFGRKEIVINEAGEEEEIIVDEDYISRSIKYPNEQIVESYQKGLMVSYESALSDEQIKQITEYLKTLGE